MLKVDLLNFRIFRSLTFHDPGRVSLIVGYNESGKTSFVQAIKWAFTGEAFGHRGKDLGSLITHGEDRLSASVTLADDETEVSVRRTTSTGDSLKSVAMRLGVAPEVLPLGFDARLCGDGGNKHMRAFLASAGEQRFSAATHFAQDPAVRGYVEAAMKAGRTTTKQIISFCTDQRAASRPPPDPEQPQVPEPSMSDLQQSHDVLGAIGQEVTGLTQQLSTLYQQGQALNALVQHVDALARVEEARSAVAAQGEDTLAGRRPALLQAAQVNTETLKRMTDCFERAGLDFALEDLRKAQSAAQQAVHEAQALLQKNPEPPGIPPTPVLSDPVHHEVWEQIKRDVGREPTREDLIAAINALREQDAEIRQKYEHAQNRHHQADLEYSRLNQHAGQWQAFREAIPRHQEQVAQKRHEWESWDHAAKAIKAAEEEFLASTGDKFGEMVSEFSKEVLNGRRVHIDRERGICLGTVPIEECSESTKWRVEVAVMAAVNRTLEMPLMLIDGADILDVHNRTVLTRFLRESIAPFFKHTVLTLTAHGTLEEEPPLPAEAHLYSKWIVRGGRMTRMEPAERPSPPSPPPFTGSPRPTPPPLPPGH